MIATGEMGRCAGIQGMTWTDPPILDDPDETIIVSGRRSPLYRDGGRTRLIAFRTRRAAYRVANTLSRSPTNRQMLATAQSPTRLRQAAS